jgi:hypothetical protein
MRGETKRCQPFDMQSVRNKKVDSRACCTCLGNDLSSVSALSTSTTSRMRIGSADLLSFNTCHREKNRQQTNKHHHHHHHQTKQQRPSMHRVSMHRRKRQSHERMRGRGAHRQAHRHNSTNIKTTSTTISVCAGADKSRHTYEQRDLRCHSCRPSSATV